MKHKSFSRAMAILLAFMMVFTMMPGVGFADDTAEGTGAGQTTVTPAADATVYLTVNNQGVIAKDNAGEPVIWKEVLVSDLDSNGSLTFDEAMTAAHVQYNSADGYSASYGYVSKLWGISTSNVLFFINNTGLTTGVTASSVQEGDRLIASINADSTYYSDWYTFFDKTECNTTVGTELTLNLKGHYGMAWEAEDMTDIALSGISIGTWSDGTFTQIPNAVTDANGNVTLSFGTAGIYYVTAQGTVRDTVDVYSPGFYRLKIGEQVVYGKTGSDSTKLIAYTETDYGAGPYPLSEIKFVDSVEWEANTDAYHILESSNVYDYNDCPIIAPACIIRVAGNDAAVNMTVSNQGVLVADNNGEPMANRPVTVRDLNYDGTLTYDEALAAAHAQYNSAVGYKTEESNYGAYVTKLWGVDTTDTYFYANNAALSYGVGSTTVKNGDYLTAAIIKDTKNRSDIYTYFEPLTKTVKSGETFTLTLKGNRSTGTAALEKMQIGTWNQGTFTAIDGKTTAADGTVSLAFDAPGIYYVTAQGTVSDSVVTDRQSGASETMDCAISAPVCIVDVEGKASAFTGHSSNAVKPAFSQNITEYALTSPLAAGTSSVSVKWTYDADLTAKASYIKADGSQASVAVKSGKNTSISSLKAGTTAVTFNFYDVDAAAGDAPKYIYKLAVERLPGVKSFAVTDETGGDLTLTPAFKAATKEYSAAAVAGSKVTFTAAFNDDANTELRVKTGNGAYAKYTGGEYTLAEGENLFHIKAVSTDDTTEGTEYTLTITGVPAASAAKFTVTEDAVVTITDPQNGNTVTLPEPVTANGKDTYTLTGLMSGYEYSYRVGKYGYFAKAGTFTAGKDTEVLLEASSVPATTVSSEWNNFRNSDTNNGITSAETPRTAAETALKWVTAESMNQSVSSYQIASAAPMLIVNDYLVTTQGSKLVQIDRETGKIVKSQEMDSYNGNLGNSPIAFGGNMIFVPLFNGKVQAFDAKTLQPMWISESLGTQCTTALIYDNGYVYGSTGNQAPAAFFCLNAADEDTSAANEVKTATWMVFDEIYTKGSYWSTPLIIGDYVVYGTDAGTDGNAAVISRDKKTGELISKSVLTGLGDQRSSLVYSEDTDTIYFTAKNAAGGLCKIGFSEASGTLSAVTALTSETKYLTTTSSPNVYNGTVYFSVNVGFNKSKYLIAVDETTFTEKYRVEYVLKTSGGVQSSALLTTAYEDTDGAVYLYVTQNVKPGELYVAKDNGKSMTMESLLSLNTKYQQANICSAITDSDGTLYFRNDAGYIFALERNTAERQTVIFNITDVAGNSIEDADIVIQNTENDVQCFEAETDGSYQLLPGTYSYTITKNGYTEATGIIKVEADALNIPISMKTGDEVTGDGESAAPAPETITITVNGHDGKANYPSQTLNYTQGMTALSVLQAVARHLEWESTQFGAYVVGIDGLAEFDYGSGSGWMYTVNGSAPQYSAALYELSAGDSVVWIYTTNLGNDIGLGNPEEEKSDVTTSTGSAGTATGTSEIVTTTTTSTEVTVSGSTATATITKENVTETIKQATENKSAEIVVQVTAADTKGAETVKVQLDTQTVKDVADKTEAILTVKTENATVTLDRETLKTVISEATGSTVTLEVIEVAKPTKAHKAAAGENGHIIQLVIKSGDKIISLFNEGKATVTVEIPSRLDGKKVAAIHIGEDGKVEHLKGQEVTVGGKKHYRFDTPHFSTFALVDAEEIGLEVEELTAEGVKALMADLTPVARSVKTPDKNVLVTLQLDDADKAIIAQIEEAGYTVKYNYYRSTKKSAKYKSMLIKDTVKYTNTKGKKDTMYYYKVRVQVYDAEDKLIARNALKDCRYANRKWTK